MSDALETFDTSGRTTVVQILAPPADEFCDAGLCAQKACCTVIVASLQAELNERAKAAAA